MPDMVQVRRTTGPRQRPEVKVGRSQFDRSHTHKTSFDASRLVPILVDEVLPGDTFTLKTHGFCRIFSPLLSPIMDNIEVETLFFYVPNRLVWSNWQYFNGEHDESGQQDTSYTIPICANGTTVDQDMGSGVEQLMGYMGIPHGLQTTQVEVNVLPLRAYNLIFNEWFRDQNLQDNLTVNVDNGPDTMSAYSVVKSNKKHDYFTTCLPYLQKGDPVAVAFDEDAEVRTDVGAGSTVSVYSTSAGDDMLLDANAAQVDVSATPAGSPSTQHLYADLQNLTGITINALRQSVAIQRLLERDARGGTRYTEIIKAHFGVTVPDYRLQRPEYLGGGKSYINISPVANTSATATEDQGELRAVGTGRVTGGFAKSFSEHGYIIGLIRARADLTYFQGLERMWSRSTRYDFYIPALANLGEQSVLNKELYISNSSATDDGVFGYQERWAEYRQKKSQITSVFNPDVTGALSQWHLAEDFSSLPSLNAVFIKDQTPMDRVVAVTTEHDFIADLYFDYKCARPIPLYSVPSLVPRF